MCGQVIHIVIMHYLKLSRQKIRCYHVYIAQQYILSLSLSPEQKKSSTYNPETTIPPPPPPPPLPLRLDNKNF